jgi:predicted flap endonuclease-1-like 5' DNA nuclease
MLLLGLAYLLGCCVACLARRMIGAPAGAVVSRDALPAGAAATVPAAPAPQSEPTPPRAPALPARAAMPAAQPVRDAFRRADTLEPSPAAPATARVQPQLAARPAAPTPSPSLLLPRSDDAVTRFEKALTGAPEAPTRAPEPPAAAIAAAAAAAAARAATARPEQAAPPPATQAATRQQPPDDLKRIRTIDQGLEAALHRLGINSFAQIGAWKPADVARLSQALGFKGRIEQENWIEQAQILASGKETYYSSRLERGEAVAAAPVADQAERRPAPSSAPQPAAPPAAAAPQRPAPAVAPPSAAAVRPALAAPGAPATPQPAVETTRAQRSAVEAAAAAATALAAAAAAARATTAQPAAAEPAPPAAVSDKAAFAERRASSAAPVEAASSAAPVAPSAGRPATQPAPAAPIPRPAVPARDVLQRIGGVTPEIEKLLNVQGISRYSQIAQWMANDIERFDRLLGHQGRIQRENWIEQAQILARGGDTTFSRDYDRRHLDEAAAHPAPTVTRVQAPSAPLPASAPHPEALPGAAPDLAVAAAASLAAGQAQGVARPSRLADAIRDRETRGADLAGLRSVGGRSATMNDLKRIRGIGVLIEKRLNSMGVTSYGQIAEWTAQDIERVSQVLDFKGRIERENWVEQARILASGGQTEFSRRTDRSEAG